MAWVLLVLASVLEAAWALGLPYTQGFTRLWPSVLVGLAMLGSFVLLAQAARTIPASTAYAVWVGLGVALAVMIEAVFFGKLGTPLRWGFVVLLLGAVVGLKATTPAAATDDSGHGPRDPAPRSSPP